MAVRIVSKGGVALAAIVALVSTPLMAAETMIRDATVTRTLASEDSRFGGCSARLDKTGAEVATAAGQSVACPNLWVTFSCSGEHTSKSNALRMFDSAQMALALGLKVDVMVDDSKKHNGFCLAKRIDVWAAPAADPAP